MILSNSLNLEVKNDGKKRKAVTQRNIYNIHTHHGCLDNDIDFLNGRPLWLCNRFDAYLSIQWSLLKLWSDLITDFDGKFWINK